MKKKGLIISTVVMVVVLIASLTTATYAWFTTSSVTSIDDFNISVVSDNAVNIGVKSDNTHELNVIDSAFVSGDVQYTPAAAGTIGGGSWIGTEGLSATLNHDIKWGAQSAAVGVTTASTAEDATIGNTGLWNIASGAKVVGANAKADGSLSDDRFLATANKASTHYSDGETGDYAYLFLGVSPTKELTSNSIVILVEGAGTNVGILSAIHVAYRITKAGADTVTSTWTDVDIFGADDPDTTGTIEGIHFNTKLADVTNNLKTEQKASYKATYNQDAPATGAYALVIDNLSITKGAIDQVELVIYLAGADDRDCIDQGKNANGTIKIFFHTVVPA